ncbi:MAG: hypothetical protein MK089_03665 [Phycisphaerales bacterium]|nr:hypothetical protein [Phycisphaerales bacterium]
MTVQPEAMATVRLGSILVQRGLLNEDQVKRVLCAQNRTGEPFGLLCERLFGLSPATIESAWAQQYAGLVDTLERSDLCPSMEALAMVTRRQAWQFRVMPVSWDDGELTLATTPNDLCRALRFATNVIGRPVYFVMTTSRTLDTALREYYPLPGIDIFSGGSN